MSGWASEAKPVSAGACQCPPALTSRPVRPPSLCPEVPEWTSFLVSVGEGCGLSLEVACSVASWPDTVAVAVACGLGTSLAMLTPGLAGSCVVWLHGHQTQWLRPRLCVRTGCVEMCGALSPGTAQGRLRRQGSRGSSSSALCRGSASTEEVRPKPSKSGVRPCSGNAHVATARCLTAEWDSLTKCPWLPPWSQRYAPAGEPWPYWNPRGPIFTVGKLLSSWEKQVSF